MDSRLFFKNPDGSDPRFSGIREISERRISKNVVARMVTEVEATPEVDENIDLRSLYAPRSTAGVWAAWAPEIDRHKNTGKNYLEFATEGTTEKQYFSGITAATVYSDGNFSISKVFHIDPTIEPRWIESSRYTQNSLEELLAELIEVAENGDEQIPTAQEACRGFIDSLEFPPELIDAIKSFGKGDESRAFSEIAIGAINTIFRSEKNQFTLYCPFEVETQVQ